MRTRHFLPVVLALSIGLTLVLSGIASVVRAQADYPTITYGQTLTGEIKADAQNDAAAYQFDAAADDSVTVVMKRTSGTLRPLLTLFDTSKGTPQLLASGKLSSDGKTATISSFTLSKAGQYVLLATREGVSKGTTIGKFSITLQNDSSNSTGSDATPTATPRANGTKPAPTKKPTANKPTVAPTDTAPTDAAPTDMPTDAAPTDMPTPAATIHPTARPSAKPTASSNATVTTIQVGTMPVYGVWSGNNLYVANQGDSTVSILDGDGNVTGTITTGGAPQALAWDGTRLWVADFGTDQAPGNSVSVYSDTGKKVGTYKVGLNPLSMSYDPDNQRMWVALYGDDKVVALNLKGKIVSTIDVSGSGHSPNTVLWAGTQLWVTLQGALDKPDNKVLTIDTDGNITNTIEVGKQPVDFAWDDADQIMYVANYGDDTINALDATGKITGTYPVGKNPTALAWDGKHLWCTLDADKSVVVLDSTGQVLTTVALDDAPNGITFDTMSSMWVSLPGTTDKPGSSLARIDITSAVP